MKTGSRLRDLVYRVYRFMAKRFLTPKTRLPMVDYWRRGRERFLRAPDVCVAEFKAASVV